MNIFRVELLILQYVTKAQLYRKCNFPRLYFKLHTVIVALISYCSSLYPYKQLALKFILCQMEYVFIFLLFNY